MFECSFRQLKEKTASDCRVTCRSIYKIYSDSAYQLDQKHRLIFDTNVLLGYYQLPSPAQKALKKFIINNLGRIYCSTQIKKEFVRNHRSVQKSFAKSICIDATATKFEFIEKTIQNYYDDNELLLQAYPNFKLGLENNLLEVRLNAQQYVQKSTSKTKALRKFYKDNEWFDLVDQIPLIPALPKSNVRQLEQEFDALQAQISVQIQDPTEEQFKYFFSKNPSLKFPGYADLLKKRLRPYGDFIIYHEILHWIKSNSFEIPPVFLTNDIAKGDWIDAKKRPYWHYLEHMYQNSQQIFFIFHAAACFEATETISFEHLISSAQITKDQNDCFFEYRQGLASEQITQESLRQLLQQVYPYRQTAKLDPEAWTSKIIHLEQEFGLSSIQNLEDDLLDNYTLLLDYELNHFCYLTQLEALQQTLDIIFI